MRSSYDQYYNMSLVQYHYVHAKNLSSVMLKDRLERGAGLNSLSIFFVIICTIIVLENLLVLVSILQCKKLHTAMFFFIGNLALSDLLAGIAYIINLFLSGPRTFQLAPVHWFLREGAAFTMLSASAFSLLAIAIERYIAIAKVKLYGTETTCRMFLLIGACWVASVLLGALPLLGWNCIGDLRGCSAVLPLYSKCYILTTITIFSAIILSILILYVRIYLVVRSSLQEDTVARSYALLKTVTIVLAVFITCWLPAFSILILDTFCSVSSCPVLVKAEVFFGVAMLNSALNPVIYTLRSEDMRREFLRLLCCCVLLLPQSEHLPHDCLVLLRSTRSLERCSSSKHEHQALHVPPDCTSV